MKTETFNAKTFAKTAELDASALLAGEKNCSQTEEHNTEKYDIPDIPDIKTFSSRYEPICDFTSGGVGHIYKARDLLFDRVVAVKELQDKYSDDEGANARFLEENMLNAKLEHPSIIPIYGIGRSKTGKWSAAMKFIPGKTLRVFLDGLAKSYRKKKVSSHQERIALFSRLEYFLRICEVVDYCHQCRIVHGDLKPENILLGSHSSLYLLDWGCAKPVDTELRKAIGTPNYLPPEFFDKPVLNVSLDVYSLGVILFELVTMVRGGTATVRRGKTGLFGKTESGKDSDHDSALDIHDPASYCHLNKDLKLNFRIVGVIKKAISLDPSKRYQTVRELITDIRHFIFGEPVSAVKEPVFHIIFHWINDHRIFTACMIILLFSGYIGWFLFGSISADFARQKERSSRILYQSIRRDTTELAYGIDMKKIRLSARLFRLVGTLEQLDARRSRQDEKIFDNASFKSAATAPQDFVYRGDDRNRCSMRQSVCLRRGPRSFVFPSSSEFARAASAAENADLMIGNPLEHSPMLDHQDIKRYFVQWNDGTRYSWPGMFEDITSKAYLKRWDISRKSRYNRTPLYEEGKDLLFSEFQKVEPVRGKTAGVAAVELRVGSLLKSVMDESRISRDREYHFFTQEQQILTVSGGRCFLLNEKQSPAGIPRDTLLSTAKQVRTMNRQLFQSSVRGRQYVLCGVRVRSIPDGILLQVIPRDVLEKREEKRISE